MSTAEQYLQDYRSLRHGAGAVRGNRDVLLVHGPDAEDFLQGQLSGDVAALAPGEVAGSLLLHPDGKLHSVLRVTRAAADTFVCDTAAGAGEAAVARLERFKLRVAVDVELRRLAMLAVRGPAAPPMPPAAGLSAEAAADDDSGPGRTGTASGAHIAVVAAVRWGSLPGWDLVADEVEVPPGVAVCDPAALEAVRIEAGVPAGEELTDGLIPAESGIVADTVSFTKGCFVGQELVARIDSRGGNVPRRLRGVISDDGTLPAPGSVLRDSDGAAVGHLTSSAYSPHFGAAVALAYVRRRLEPPAPGRIDDGAGGVVCEIRPLPLIP